MCRKVKGDYDVDKIIKSSDLLKSGKVSTGGYALTFNDSIDIPSYELYKVGINIPLSKDDLIGFLKNNILDTSESCDLLECTRQNLTYLSKKERLQPIREKIQGNLYLKGDVLRNSW